jgi:hypothetical protein
MASRRYKRVRMAGQNLPPFNLCMATALCWGRDLFGGVPSEICIRPDFKSGDDDYGELDIELARAAWNQYKVQVLDSWVNYWHSDLAAYQPTPWAARVFDGVPQIKPPRKSRDENSQIEWARERIASIENEVQLAKERTTV